MQKVVLFFALVAVAAVRSHSDRPFQPEQKSQPSNRFSLGFWCGAGFLGEILTMKKYARRCKIQLIRSSLSRRETTASSELQKLKMKICIAERAGVVGAGPAVDMDALRTRLSRVWKIWFWSTKIKPYVQAGIDGCPDVENFELKKFRDCVIETCSARGIVPKIDCPDFSINVTWTKVEPGYIGYDFEVQGLGETAVIEYQLTSDAGFKSEVFNNGSVGPNYVVDNTLSPADFCKNDTVYTVRVTAADDICRQKTIESIAPAAAINRESFSAPSRIEDAVVTLPADASSQPVVQIFFNSGHLCLVKSIVWVVNDIHEIMACDNLDIPNSIGGNVTCECPATISNCTLQYDDSIRFKATMYEGKDDTYEFTYKEYCGNKTDPCYVRAGATDWRYILSHNEFGRMDYPLEVAPNPRVYSISASHPVGRVYLEILELEFYQANENQACDPSETFLEINGVYACGKMENLAQTNFTGSPAKPMIVKFETNQTTEFGRGYVARCMSFL